MQFKATKEEIKMEVMKLEEEIDGILFHAEEMDRELTTVEEEDIRRLERLCQGLLAEVE